MCDSSRWVVNTLDDYGRVTQTGFFQDSNGDPDNNNPIINNGSLTETFYDGGFGVSASTDPIYSMAEYAKRERAFWMVIYQRMTS